MQTIVKEDILRLLQKAQQALKEHDASQLSEISNHVIHDASIFQDEDTINLAVLIYAISKIMQRCTEKERECPNYLPFVEIIYKALLDDNIGKYRHHVKKQLIEITKQDKKMNMYVQEVIEKARVKKASKIYEHGISIARTAELLGTNQWEVHKYVGNVVTDHPEGQSVIKRLNKARTLFK